MKDNFWALKLLVCCFCYLFNFVDFHFTKKNCSLPSDTYSVAYTLTKSILS